MGKKLNVSHSPSSLVLELAVLLLQTLSRRMTELSDLFGKLLMGRSQVNSLKFWDNKYLGFLLEEGGTDQETQNT